jgi:Rrf2 family transcriptional regulator, nitric oxide-sensitive transcriptional repressor
MISQTAEYALRAIVFLAEKGSKPQTIQQIARVTQVPAGYLSKVMQGLARSGLVNSQRGLHGGFTLAATPSELTIYEIVQAVDPIPRITRCPLNNPAHATELCALHRRLDEAAAQVERSFRESTVADLLTKPIFHEEENRDEATPEPATAVA